MSTITHPAGFHEVTVQKGLRFRGAFAVQKGTPMMTAFVTAGELIPSTKVDTFDPDTKEGYQRERQMPRVRAAATYYKQGGRMPNPLLVNVRSEDFDKVELRVLDDDGGYQDAIDEGGDWIGSAEIFVPAGVTIWVYDGQHREGAVRELLESMESVFSSFPIPISMTLGLASKEEMREFYEVNQNARSVKTDLAWELLRQMAADDPELAELLEIKGRGWQTKGPEVADELVRLSGVWAESIQEANERKTSSDRLTLNKAQFVRSLQPVLNYPPLAKADPTQIAKILDAYWAGIAKVLPEPFDPSNDPKKYVIQKGPGAIAFHRVLPQVIELLRASGARLADPEAYASVLHRIPQLSGEIMTEDGVAIDVKGADFWRAGPEGVASQWTGDAGRKRLAVRIQALLDRPSELLNL